MVWVHTFKMISVMELVYSWKILSILLLAHFACGPVVNILSVNRLVSYELTETWFSWQAFRPISRNPQKTERAHAPRAIFLSYARGEAHTARPQAHEKK